jgi:dTMP kinase
MLIVIEGLDGAGKRTLTEGLRRSFEADGRSVTTCAFPRYGRSITADLASEALHGQHGDLAASVYAMAVLFALDRAGAKDQIAALSSQYDVVVLDRYVASNAAYCAARMYEGAGGGMVSWVGEFEYGRVGLPEPDCQILLDVPPELAAQRARHRESSEADRVRDAYERDDGLQHRTGAVYRDLAAMSWHGRWSVAGPDVDPAALAADLSV